MGYTTDFRGSFKFNKTLSPKMLDYLTKFNETRRMARNVDNAFGTEGEFYVFGSGFMGQNDESNVIDCNREPKTQPGLWCKWTPSDDGTELEWDGSEKFYYYTEWLFYLINKIIAPNGYVLYGEVDYRGEDFDDHGTIEVRDNVIYLNGEKYTDDTTNDTTRHSMELHNVLILDNIEKLLK